MEKPEPLPEPQENPQPGIEVYGTLWCAHTQRVRRHLDQNQLAYVFHNVETESAAASQVRWWAGGNVSHPTLLIGGEILVEPSIPELDLVLDEKGFIRKG